MYKKFTTTELATIQNNFIPHLRKIIQQEKCQGINDFFKVISKQGNEVLYFERGNVSFRVALEKDMLHFYDEKEAIEISIPADEKYRLQDLLKKFIIHKERQTGQKSIKDLLGEAFKEGKFLEMLGKPYLVYDIETALIGTDLQETEFYLGYYMEEREPGKTEYLCITQGTLAAFVDKMLNFDGYIIGFNQMYFDNPVCIYNTRAGETPAEREEREKAIKKLNEKSLDLFVFVQHLTGKRLGLNKLSGDLIGIEKNLEGGGASVESLWKAWKLQNDKKALQEIKSYCENDVRMTVLLLYYLLYFKRISLNGEEYNYEVETFLQLANNQSTSNEKTQNAVSLRD